MKLAPREIDKLMLHNAGELAQKRLARGLRLNYTESIALIATQVRTIDISSKNSAHCLGIACY